MARASTRWTCGGNGRSPGIRGATDIGDAVDDHVAARRVLQNLSRPVFVLGHSVGGLVTTSSVLNHPPDVEGMILIAPALRWEVSAGMRNTARMISLFVPSRPVPVPAPDPILQSRDSTFHRRLLGDSLYHHGAIPWITAATGATVAHRNWNRYAELSVPLLVVNGSDDQVTTPDAARAFIDLAGSTDKTLVLVEGGRHMLLDDPPSSTEALDAILAWIDQRLSRSETGHSRKAR
jgi:acylglycerol lipase